MLNLNISQGNLESKKGHTVEYLSCCFSHLAVTKFFLSSTVGALFQADSCVMRHNSCVIRQCTHKSDRVHLHRGGISFQTLSAAPS